MSRTVMRKVGTRLAYCVVISALLVPGLAAEGQSTDQMPLRAAPPTTEWEYDLKKVDIRWVRAAVHDGSRLIVQDPIGQRLLEMWLPDDEAPPSALPPVRELSVAAMDWNSPLRISNTQFMQLLVRPEGVLGGMRWYKRDFTDIRDTFEVKSDGTRPRAEDSVLAVLDWVTAGARGEIAFAYGSLASGLMPGEEGWSDISLPFKMGFFTFPLVSAQGKASSIKGDLLHFVEDFDYYMFDQPLIAGGSQNVSDTSKTYYIAVEGQQPRLYFYDTAGRGQRKVMDGFPYENTTLASLNAAQQTLSFYNDVNETEGVLPAGLYLDEIDGEPYLHFLARHSRRGGALTEWRLSTLRLEPENHRVSLVGERLLDSNSSFLTLLFTGERVIVLEQSAPYKAGVTPKQGGVDYRQDIERLRVYSKAALISHQR